MGVRKLHSNCYPEPVSEKPTSEHLRPARKHFLLTLERKIDGLWCGANAERWSYTDFVAHALEVLAVLQHREKLERLRARKSARKA